MYFPVKSNKGPTDLDHIYFLSQTDHDHIYGISWAKQAINWSSDYDHKYFLSQTNCGEVESTQSLKMLIIHLQQMLI
jgi:hypothetical protein